jgi:hypothetical protein
VYGGNVDIVTIDETSEVSQQLIVIVTVMTERNVSIFVSGELVNGHSNAVLPVEGEEGLGIFVEVLYIYISKACQKHFR